MVFLHTLRVIAVDLILNTLYFPIWWYTEGVKKVSHNITNEVRSLTESLHLRTLLAFLFKPMYGQTDIWGRIISVGVRVVHFGVLLLFTVLYTLLLSLLLIVWIILPLFIVYNLIIHLGPTFTRLYA
jgi:hypothetical protein